MLRNSTDARVTVAGQNQLAGLNTDSLNRVLRRKSFRCNFSGMTRAPEWEEPPGMCTDLEGEKMERREIRNGLGDFSSG